MEVLLQIVFVVVIVTKCEVLKCVIPHKLVTRCIITKLAAFFVEKLCHYLSVFLPLAMGNGWVTCSIF
jgi:hypothetical protein